MADLRAAAQAAIDAMVSYGDDCRMDWSDLDGRDIRDRMYEIADGLREAIAAPEPELWRNDRGEAVTVVLAAPSAGLREADVRRLKAFIRTECPSNNLKWRVDDPTAQYDPLVRLSAIFGRIDDWAASIAASAPSAGLREVPEGPWRASTEGHASIDAIVEGLRASLEVNPLNTDATYILTADGSKIVAFVGNGPRHTDNAALIVEAVNRPAPSIDAERLARALHRTGVGCFYEQRGATCGPTDDRIPRPIHETQAAAIAAAYAAEGEDDRGR